MTDFRFMNDPTEIIRSLNFAADYIGTIHQKVADDLGLPATSDYNEAMELGTRYLNTKYNVDDPNYYTDEYLRAGGDLNDPRPSEVWNKEEMLRVKKYCVTSCFAGKTAQDLNWLDHIKCYVMSFSEEGDALPQWRAYCQRGGYSLGFTGFTVSEHAQGRLRLRPCFYGTEEEHNAIMRLEVEKLVEQWTQNTSYPHPNPLHPGEMATAAAEWRGTPSPYGSFAYRLTEAAALLKHQSFVDEREWRILILKPDGLVMGVNHRPRANYLVPYAYARQNDQSNQAKLSRGFKENDHSSERSDAS